MTITKTTKRTENDFVKAIYDNAGNIIDIADLTGKTPFEDLCTKEEAASIYCEEEHREAQVEALSGLMSYLMKDKNPLQICIRAFLICYVVRPELIDGMTLAEIGNHLGGLSRQRIGAKLKLQDAILPVKGRNRKSEAQKAQYSTVQKAAWIKRKAA
ncbi:MAG: hypothetical protein WCO97_05510 [bacterium]